MFIKEIVLTNFRNYNQNKFVFSPEGSIIVGPNGTGKTNLLEAISFPAFGKSIRQIPDSELIKFNEKEFFLTVLFADKDNKSLKYHISYNNKGKKIKLNNNFVTKISDLYEFLKIVYFSSEDIALINGTRQKRRFFFDQSITQTNMLYGYTLKEYLKILHQRSCILKENKMTNQLSMWNKLFVTKALEIYCYREKFLEKFNIYANDYLNRITNSPEKLCINYQKQGNFDSSSKSMMDYLENLYDSEIEQGRTLTGPHLDEYDICLNNHSAKKFASQGQKRSIAIALRFAQLEMIKHNIKSKPIIIFDDALSELDKNRVDKIVSFLDDKYQILIATPNEENFKAFNLPKIELK